MEVTSLHIDGKRCVGVKTSSGEIFHAAQVVLAAGCWSSQIPEAAPFAPTAPVRGQLAALRHSGIPIRHVLRSEHGYIVPRGMDSPQTVVVGSTLENAGYEKRVTSGGIEKILSAANELVPGLAAAEIIETWSGLRPGTPDQLPILGPTDIDGLVLATGHYRNGILLAPITAKLVGEWIADRRTSFEWDAFSPLRFSLFLTPMPTAPQTLSPPSLLSIPICSESPRRRAARWLAAGRAGKRRSAPGIAEIDARGVEIDSSIEDHIDCRAARQFQFGAARKEHGGETDGGACACSNARALSALRRNSSDARADSCGF